MPEMLLFSTSQLNVSFGASTATWTTTGPLTKADLTFVDISDDDTSLQRNDVFFGNESGAPATITASDDASIIGLEIYLGDLNPHNGDGDGWLYDEHIYDISSINADIVTVAIYSGTGDTTNPANYEQYYGIWGGGTAEAALDQLLATGTLETNLGRGTGGLSYGGFAACFCAGTLIRTPDGDRPVEEIAVGDAVLTMDEGSQPVRWVGSRALSAAELRARPNLAPIRVRAGAMGPDLPRRDMRLSPQHRVLLRSSIVARMYRSAEVLAPICKLLDAEGIERAGGAGGVRYRHLLFDRHQVVFANGMPAESLFLGSYAQRAMPDAALAEIASVFPDLAGPGEAMAPARRLAARRSKLAHAVRRHRKNAKPLCDHPGTSLEHGSRSLAA